MKFTFDEAMNLKVGMEVYHGLHKVKIVKVLEGFMYELSDGFNACYKSIRKQPRKIGKCFELEKRKYFNHEKTYPDGKYNPNAKLVL